MIGYGDVRAVRAGGRLSFFVSSEKGGDYDAQLFRLRSPEIGPLGPPFKAEAIDASINGRHPGVHQPIRPGSYARVAGPLPVSERLAFEVLILPTLVEDSARTVAMFSSTSGMTLTLDHGRTAGLRAIVRRVNETVAEVAVPTQRDHAWTDIAVNVDLAAGRLSLRSRPLRAEGFVQRDQQSDTATWTPVPDDTFTGVSLAIGASIDGDGHHEPATCFNGKLERPRLFDLSDDPTPLAQWDFSLDIPTEAVRDTGPSGLHGTLHNLPTRGTRGSTWTGEGLSWVADPASYAAIHFHDDDLADAGWEASLTYDVPDDLPSACYAVRLEPADGSTPEFWVPFIVRPAVGAATRSIAYVIPTTTYGAYANMHLRVTAQFNELAHGRLTVLDSTDFLLLTMPELGKSTYDTHRDGSPVIYSSMNRPVTNFRPTGRMYKFCLDLMITDWLDGMDFDVDVITDDDLHAEGAQALAPYRVAITGSHPEYLTRVELDAFEQFTRTGGRLMYLGGNGFYSAAEIPRHRLDVVEVRRPGQDNLWRVNHAEGTFSTSGLPGGLWRNIGRPENAVIGVGFITQGFDACTGYTRSGSSHDHRVSWIFDGLEPGASIGDFGILQGGAAGYEIDRHDISKGSPPHSIVVASSGGHSNLYDLMVPSILDTLPDPTRTQDAIRADMVFFETDGGGAVFSVGSIAWSGSLSYNDYDNSVSRVTANVLRRFDDPAPFVPPDDA